MVLPRAQEPPKVPSAVHVLLVIQINTRYVVPLLTMKKVIPTHIHTYTKLYAFMHCNIQPVCITYTVCWEHRLSSYHLATNILQRTDLWCACIQLATLEVVKTRSWEGKVGRSTCTQKAAKDL